jgi:hypothetical protein
MIDAEADCTRSYVTPQKRRRDHQVEDHAPARNF